MQHFTLIKKVALFQTLLLFSVFIFISITTFFLTKNYLLELEENHMKYRISKIENNFLERMEFYKSHLQLLIKDEALEKYADSYEENMVEYFLQKYSHIFTSIAYFDEQGNEISSRINGEKINLNTKIDIKSLKNKKEIDISSILFDKHLNEYVIVLSLSKINFFDEFKGVLVVKIPISNFFHQGDEETSTIRVVKNNTIVFSDLDKESNMHLFIADLYSLSQSHHIHKLQIHNENTYSIISDWENNTFILLSIKKDSLNAIPNKLIQIELVIFSLILLLVNFTSIFIIKKKFLNYLNKIVELTKEISKGNLSKTIHINTNDEMEILADNFNTMTQSLNRSMLELKTSSEKIEKLNEKLQDQNKQLDNKVQEQIDALRQKDQVIMHQAKLASMGEMIGNIAHQWRQPINNLSVLNISLVQKYLLNKLDDEFMDHYQEKSNMLIQKMSSTIDDFRNFFSPNKTKKDFLIQEAVHEVIEITKASLDNHHIELIENYQETNQLHTFKNEFEQVILNLISNSKDALIKNNVEKKKISIETFETEDTIFIEFYDNGGGIDKTVLEKVFEPYFTTKFKDQGTGIGMYMSKIIIEKHMKGSISIENYEDGAKVIIKIPKEDIK